MRNSKVQGACQNKVTDFKFSFHLFYLADKICFQKASSFTLPGCYRCTEDFLQVSETRLKLIYLIKKTLQQHFFFFFFLQLFYTWFVLNYIVWHLVFYFSFAKNINYGKRYWLHSSFCDCLHLCVCVCVIFKLYNQASN